MKYLCLCLFLGMLIGCKEPLTAPMEILDYCTEKCVAVFGQGRSAAVCVNSCTTEFCEIHPEDCK